MGKSMSLMRYLEKAKTFGSAPVTRFYFPAKVKGENAYLLLKLGWDVFAFG